MKKADLSLSAVITQRQALTEAEQELIAMRERLASARSRVDTLKAELTQREEDRRQAVISGGDEGPALVALQQARLALEHGMGNVELLEQAEGQREQEVLAAEGQLLEAQTAARLARYDATKAELEAALLRFAPPFRAAALNCGLVWATPGDMLKDIGSRDIYLGDYPPPPPELATNSHKSPLVSEETRRA